MMQMSSPSCSLVSSSATTEGGSTVQILPASDFTLFPNLTTELRLQIWRFSVEDIGPRIIPIDPDDEFEDQHQGEFCCVARINPPALLATCSESRAVAQSVYTLKFGLQLRRPVYFDPTRDILLMNRTRSMYSFLQSTYPQERRAYRPCGRDEVSHLALLVNDSIVNHGSEDDLHGYPSWRQVAIAARGFANLKCMKLIYQAEHAEQTLSFLTKSGVSTLEDFWKRHWMESHETMRKLLRADPIPTRHDTPSLVFWTRENLLLELSNINGVHTDLRFYGRARSKPEPFLGRMWSDLYVG